MHIKILYIEFPIQCPEGILSMLQLTAVVSVTGLHYQLGESSYLYV